MTLLRHFAFAFAFATLTGAAGAATPQERAADEAVKLVGAPYRYGGMSPKGFDCSGLVLYSYRQAGVTLPHSTEQQRHLGKPVRRSELRPGDLVFFDQRGKKHGHVALYVGNGEMVHAPSSGKRVRRDRLDSPYWKKHLSEARRVSA
jgi:cell wall-associated NlpC family hydrolase